MRDFLAHHYFATRPDIVQWTIDSVADWRVRGRAGRSWSAGGSGVPAVGGPGGADESAGEEISEDDAMALAKSELAAVRAERTSA